MSLLTPLYLLGLAAVALPVLFHLIRRQPRGRRVFSTVMFLEPSPPTVTRRSRLDHWPLLLLRAAALCLLALAFARPLLRELIGIDVTPETGESIVVLVDTSASMRRERLWERAIERTEAITAESRPADRVSVLTFDREIRPLVTFEEWSAVDPSARPQLVRERLKSASPGWAATHLDQALRAAVELLQAPSSPQDSLADGAKRVVLVSDLADGSRLDRLTNGEWPQDVMVAVERVTPRSPTNAGLQLVAAVEGMEGGATRRTEFHSVRPTPDEGGPGETAATPLAGAESEGTPPSLGGRGGTPSYEAERPNQVRVRVSNAADSTGERFQLAWQATAGGIAVDSPPVDVYCPPGQSRVVPVAVPAGLVLPAELALRGDDHPFDNIVTVDQPAFEPVHIVFYTDEPAGDPAGLRYYLERAFATAGARPVIISSQLPGGPGPVPVPRDVPLVIAGAAPTDDLTPGLSRYVEHGGTLLIVAADVDAPKVWERLFVETDLSVEQAEVAGYAMLSDIDFGHPLFAPFNEPRFADFTSVRVWRHRQLTFEDSDASVLRVLARFDSGAPAILEQPLGRGRVLLFAFGWHPSDSQLALSTKFVPLLHALVGLAAGQDDEPRRLLVGDPLPLAGRTHEAAAGSTVHTPDGHSIQLTATGSSAHRAVVPGIYRVASDSSRDQRFTVSLPPEESRTTPLGPEQLESFGVRLAAVETQAEAAARTDQERQLRTEELENGQKHWRWLIVAALAVLILETGLAGRTARMVQGNRMEEVTAESRRHGTDRS